MRCCCCLHLLDPPRVRMYRFSYPLGISLPILPTAFWQPLTTLSLPSGGEDASAMIASDAHVLGISLSEDSKAAARWSLTSGGEYYGVGAGVGISGFRANLGVGDDLFGSREG